MKYYNTKTKETIWENHIETKKGIFFLDSLTKEQREEFSLIPIVENKALEQPKDKYQYIKTTTEETEEAYIITEEIADVDIEMAKSIKLEELKKIRESKIAEPLNNVDVRNEKDIDNLDGSIRYFESLTTTGKIKWTMSDDTDKEMTKAELEEILKNYALRKALIFSQYQAYKTQVSSASSIDAIKAIVWG
ncbi:DUF4376 domain-containing protein [Campylobacter sp. RM16192]|uniref:DUF4376 domain-containing protein n=1 Tax=Campylobacter sp. RM16192 TaxID=1660080 RepID=UPI001451D4F8|nr:DUF4376 domain-containing protein [Campylobacter sp. RM16192]QCD52796.1 putative protein (DUF4376 domain) [Campylobacter sp. RM16192]